MQFVKKMNHRNIHIVLLLLLVLVGFKSRAQDYKWLSNNNLMVEMRGHYGHFYHHHFEMKRFDAHYPAFEMSIYQDTYGKKQWESLYNYPYIGLTYYHANFGHNTEGNPEIGEVLGKVYAVYPFINYPLLYDDTKQLTLKFGAGLGYLTKCFDHNDEDGSHYNLSIGSNLNAAINLSFEYRQEFFSRLMGVASVGLTHFSNGATKSPNYGLNTVSGALGLAYYLRRPRLEFTPSQRPDYQPFEFDGKKWFSIDVGAYFGMKDVSATYGKNEPYLVFDLSTQLLAQFTTCSRAGFTLSVSQDYSDQALTDHYVDDHKNIFIIQEYFQNNKVYNDTISIKPYQMIKPNIGLCYSMTMERMSFLFELGVHVDLRKRHNMLYDYKTDASGRKYIPAGNLASDFSKGQYYEKIYIRYYLFDNLYANITLAAHYIRADYLCFGLSYRFNQKYYLDYEFGHKKRIPGMR